MSCIGPDKVSARVGGDDVPVNPKFDQKAAHELADHLRSIAPFNKRWEVTKTINEGTYGVRQLFVLEFLNKLYFRWFLLFVTLKPELMVLLKLQNLCLLEIKPPNGKDF